MDLSTHVEPRLAPGIFRYSMLRNFLGLRVHSCGVMRRFWGLGMGACLVRLSGVSRVRLARLSRMRLTMGHSFVTFGE
jgi:hypothetical protein